MPLRHQGQCEPRNAPWNRPRKLADAMPDRKALLAMARLMMARLPRAACVLARLAACGCIPAKVTVRAEAVTNRLPEPVWANRAVETWNCDGVTERATKWGPLNERTAKPEPPREALKERTANPEPPPPPRPI